MYTLVIIMYWLIIVVKQEAELSVILSQINIFKKKRIYTSNDIREDMQQKYGVQLTFQQTYRAREVGLEIVRGNPVKSYNLLPKYSHVLTKANEGTITHLE